MEFTLKQNHLACTKVFLNSISSVEFLNVVIDPLKGLSIYSDEPVLKAKMQFALPVTGGGEFTIKKDLLLKVVGCAENEVKVSVNQSSMKLLVDGTELFLSVPFMEFEKFPEPDMVTTSVRVSSERVQEIVSNLLVQKTPKIHMIPTMEFGSRTKYGAHTHIVSYKTADLSDLGDVLVSSEFYKYLSVIPKYKIPDWKFFKDSDWLGITCDYFTYFTPILKGQSFSDLDKVESEQIKEVTVVIPDVDTSTNIAGKLTRLFIPLYDDPDPRLHLFFTTGKVDFSVVDKSNNISRDNIALDSTVLGKDKQAIVHFQAFEAAVNKKSVKYPMNVYRLTSALLFETEELKEFVNLYV